MFQSADDLLAYVKDEGVGGAVGRGTRIKHIRLTGP